MIYEHFDSVLNPFVITQLYCVNLRKLSPSMCVLRSLCRDFHSGKEKRATNILFFFIRMLMA